MKYSGHVLRGTSEYILSWHKTMSSMLMRDGFVERRFSGRQIQNLARTFSDVFPITVRHRFGFLFRVRARPKIKFLALVSDFDCVIARRLRRHYEVTVIVLLVHSLTFLAIIQR